jgi:type IX secretion system PorP/SprF family membrane protein
MNIMNRSSLFFLVAYFAFSGMIKAQQMPLYSQYQQNLYLMNPAAAALGIRTQAGLHVRKQWTSLTQGNPETILFTAASRNDQSILAGGLQYDKWGNSSVAGGKISYARDFVFDPDQAVLSLGLSLSARQFSIQQAGYVYFDPDDHAITGMLENHMNSDVDFGALFHGQSFRIGASVFNLLNTQIVLGTNISKNNFLERVFYLYGGYDVPINNILQINPSVLMRISSSGPLSFDLNAGFSIMKNYCAGLTYRYPGAAYGFVSVQVDDFVFGYSYDSVFNSFSVTGQNAHEIFMAYKIK